MIVQLKCGQSRLRGGLTASIEEGVVFLYTSLRLGSVRLVLEDTDAGPVLAVTDLDENVLGKQAIPDHVFNLVMQAIRELHLGSYEQPQASSPHKTEV